MAIVTPSMPELAPEAVRAFRSTLRGQLIEASDAEYDDARSVRNGLIDRRPAAIVRAAGNGDVTAAVNFARERGLLLSVRGGGHNVSGNAVNDGGIVIDLSEMRGVRVDPVKKTVRAQGGATWGDVDPETQRYGLATPGGVISSTGVGGLSIHGGLGWLRRKYGYSVDSIVSVDIVTADGQLRVASEEENPDLYWAIRGAGSNFGAITSFEFRLHPVGPEVFNTTMMYDLEDGESVMRGWRDFMATAPEEISSQLLFWGVPAVDAFPTELHGKAVIIPTATFIGDPAEGERLLQPLRQLATPIADLSAAVPFATLQSQFDPFFPKGWLYYWKSLYLAGLEEPTAGALLDYARNRPTPGSLIALWHLEGGAASRVDPRATAFGRRDHPYLVSFDTTWTDPSDTERAIAWTRQTWQDAQQYSSGGVYLNFAGFGEEKEALVRAGYGANYERLATLKAMYDPANLFRMNNNIRPEVS